MAVRLARIDVQAGDPEAAERRIDAMLAMPDVPHEPAIEAMELRGDIRRQRTDDDGATVVYGETRARLDATGFVVTRKRVAVKLANLLLDRNELAAAESVIGSLIDEGDSPDALRLRARLSHLQGDAAKSVVLLETLKAGYPADWTDGDTASLEVYRAAR